MFAFAHAFSVGTAGGGRLVQTVCISERVKYSCLCGFGAVSRCQFGGQRCQNQTRQQVFHWSTGQECISHVRLVRTTRQCMEKARSRFCVTFKHTKAHGGQWQNECGDSLAKLGSYSFPAEIVLALSMAQWYQTFQVPTQRILCGDSNPLSVLFWLQVASLPDPQNSSGRRQNETTLEKKAEVSRWNAVTANVLTFQFAVEKVAAGFFRQWPQNGVQIWKSTLQANRKVGRDPAPDVRSVGILWCQLLRTEATVSQRLGYTVRTFPNRNTSSLCCQI